MPDDDKIETGRRTPPQDHEWSGIWQALGKVEQLYEEMKPISEGLKLLRNRWLIPLLFTLAAFMQGPQVAATAKTWILAIAGLVK